MTTDKTLTVNLEIEILAPPEEVWAVIGNREGMERWLGMSGFAPETGAQWEMHVTTEDGRFRFFGEVTYIDPPKELAFTWVEHEEGQEPWPTDTLVTLRLQPTENGTHVTLTHTGFEKLPAELAQSEWQGHKVGWESRRVLHGLKRLIEEGE